MYRTLREQSLFVHSVGFCTSEKILQQHKQYLRASFQTQDINTLPYSVDAY